ncbi:MAG: OsmC family protein [bacterium]
MQPKYKTHTFTGKLNWTGGRTWDFSGETTPNIPGAPPKKFRGEDGKLTPEDLMLASVNTCMLSTFTSHMATEGFEILSYESDIEGILEHTDEHGFIFTKMILKIRIEVESEDVKLLALDTLNKAHDGCWMSNSILAECIIEPEITMHSQ